MPFINERLQSNEELIEERVAKRTPRQSRFRFDPERVIAQLRARIIGQDAVIESMSSMLYTLKADIESEQRPLAVNLFLGPTGVGKTETVKVLAEAICGSPDRLCHIDMNTLAQEHYAAAITGAPPGYVGSKEGQTLLNAEAIRGSFSQPGIVLFDELEKASTEVLRALLNVMESGLLTLSAGNKVIDFRNALIFFTSNLGAEEVAAYRRRYLHGWRKYLGPKPASEAAIIDRVLGQCFDPEFINRIDNILTFERLDKSRLGSLFDLELTKLNVRLQKKNVCLQADESAKAYFCRNMDERYGARDIARRLRAELYPLLSRSLLAHTRASHFNLTLDEGVPRVTAQ